jgi:CheY-like chemotaxis protein
MDMRMPVMDGYEATRRIKAQLKGQATVIIALTASAFEEERSLVLSAGCDDFVRKPFQEEVLFEKMAQYLGVRYTYQQRPLPTSPPSAAPHSSLTADSKTVAALIESGMAAMSAEWVIELYQAANQADDELIFQLIEQIPEQNAALAKALTDLVNNLRFDKIGSLAQQARE